MAAYDLRTQGAWALAAVVLVQFSCLSTEIVQNNNNNIIFFAYLRCNAIFHLMTKLPRGNYSNNFNLIEKEIPLNRQYKTYQIQKH